MRTTLVTCPEHEGCDAALDVGSRGDTLPLSAPEWAKRWLSKQDGDVLHELRHETAQPRRDVTLRTVPISGRLEELLAAIRDLLGELAEADRRVRRRRRKAAK